MAFRVEKQNGADQINIGVVLISRVSQSQGKAPSLPLLCPVLLFVLLEIRRKAPSRWIPFPTAIVSLLQASKMSYSLQQFPPSQCDVLMLLNLNAFIIMHFHVRSWSPCFPDLAVFFRPEPFPKS
jgi:hypothetical protein